MIRSDPLYQETWLLFLWHPEVILGMLVFQVTNQILDS
jgi:hypothetical protein